MKILNELTIKHLKMNKKRTIVTIIGIILSTALMVGIGLLFSTLQDNSIRTLKMENGDYHASISGLAVNKLDILSNNHHIQEYFYESPIGFSEFKDSKIELKKYFFVNAVSDGYLKQVKLIKGRLPNNDKEIVISNQLESDNGELYHIGDEITLNLGIRIIDGEETLENSEYMGELESFKEKEKRTYKVVGIIEKPVFESWYASGYSFLTKYKKNDQPVQVFLKFKKPSRTYQDTITLSKNLGISDENSEQITYNNSLLALYGASKYGNIMNAIINVLMIILTLISIGCIIVIYNSFAISVMERKKQFGLFSSIGATKKQLRMTVFFEAFIVGVIGITLGIISSFIGIGVVIAIINHLISNLFETNLVLTAYPTFVIIPVVFMVVTILVSAYIPAHQASKITPIEAIRLNDDIKIKNKKLKTGTWVRKLFGIEGEIALKNIRRNKKKYRITVVSLFISIVLFISFSTFVEYGLKTSSATLMIPDYDIRLRFLEPSLHDYSSFMNTVKNYEGVENNIAIKSGVKYSNSYSEKDLLKDDVYQDIGHNQEFLNLLLISLDEQNYKNYLKELGLTEEKPILINQIGYVMYKQDSRKVHSGDLLKDPKKNYSFQLCELKESIDSEVPKEDDFLCNMTLDDIYITSKIPFAVESEFLHDGNIVMIVSEKIFEQLFPRDSERYLDDIVLYLKAPHYKKVDQYIKQYLDSLSNKENITYFNYPEDMKQTNNLYLVIGILLYGFISLVTLIGVTSVFNTINTSIALRRKEFAMLRSMGLTPHGFNRILYFESFFFGAKSLLYAIPVSFLVILWIHVVLMDVTTFSDILIPWKSVGIAVLAVFIIVFLTMMYATSKIKKENILDAIREENI